MILETDFQSAMLWAFYNNNRIPMWIFGEDDILEEQILFEASSDICNKLGMHISELMRSSGDRDFDILCHEKDFYFSFAYQKDGKKKRIMGGPMLLTGLWQVTDLRALSFSSHFSVAELKILAENLPVTSLTSFGSFTQMLYLYLCRQELPKEAITDFAYTSLGKSVRKESFQEYFDELTEITAHTPYHQELAVLSCVRDGDTARLESTYRTLPQTKYGKMSDDPTRQQLFGCIADTTLVTRYAIEGGMDEEEAFSLSDAYIKQLEQCRSPYQMNLLNEKMALEFTTRVAHAREQKRMPYSKAVNSCIRYITTHLDTKITLAQLSAETSLTEKYLSALFAKETGRTLKHYVEEKKIAEAKKLLLYSDHSYGRIAQILAFHSQSYFIQIFRKQTGVTPGEYRRKYASGIDHS